MCIYIYICDAKEIKKKIILDYGTFCLKDLVICVFHGLVLSKVISSHFQNAALIGFGPFPGDVPLF